VTADSLYARQSTGQHTVMSTSDLLGPSRVIPGERRALIEQMASAVRAQQNAIDAFDEAAAQALGLSRSDLRALDVLQQQGRLTAGELAHAARVSRGAMTGLVDRLESAGFVRRTHDTADRRRIFIELSEEGVARAMKVYAPVAEHAWSSTEAMTDDQLRLLREVALRGRDFYEAQVARLRAELETTEARTQPERQDSVVPNSGVRVGSEAQGG
jgi:DNA-binding MarR family transcriptional regulator